MENTPRIDDVKTALSHVMDPELGADLVSLNMIQNIAIKGKTIAFDLVLMDTNTISLLFFQTTSWIIKKTVPTVSMHVGPTASHLRPEIGAAMCLISC